MEVYKGGVSDQLPLALASGNWKYMSRALAQLCPLENDWAKAHLDKLGFTTS